MRSSVFDLQVNGITMGVHRWLPQDEVVGIVQISHGMAEHGARYAALAEPLTRAGWAVIAGDHRGHGRTATSTGTLGHFADRGGWDAVVDDLGALALHATSQHPGVPHVLLGHSMGALLARDYATQHGGDLAGLVLSGTPSAARLMGRVGKNLASYMVRFRGPRTQARLMHQLTFGSYNSAFKPNRTDYDWLSRDTAAVDAYVADPLCGFVCTNQLYVDLIGGLEQVNARAVVRRTPAKLPVLVLAGELDPAGGAGAAGAVQKLFRSSGVQDVTVETFPEARHEVFNETNRDAVIEVLVSWLEQRLH